MDLIGLSFTYSGIRWTVEAFDERGRAVCRQHGSSETMTLRRETAEVLVVGFAV